MPSEQSAELKEGLEGVVVTETQLSRVDGEAGELLLAGHDIEALAPSGTVEDVCHLLWKGRLPGEAQRTHIQQRLAEGRARAFAALPQVRGALQCGAAMDALRGAIAQLDPGAPDPQGLLMGAMAVFASAHGRLQAGQQPVAPSAELDHAADYLRMLHGEAPPDGVAAGMRSYLVTIADHGMNASTFAARVVTSTNADSVSAITAALGALKGPLHGGAPGPVLDMLDAVGDASSAEAWIAQALTSGQRIMGMGHRVYRVRDPRAAVLEAAVRRLRGDSDSGRLALAHAVERAAQRLLDARYPARRLRANVEFFTAVLLEALGIDRSLFTATFAVGRTAGWLAHVAEQRERGRLIRPAARYVGPLLS